MPTINGHKFGHSSNPKAVASLNDPQSAIKNAIVDSVMQEDRIWIEKRSVKPYFDGTLLWGPFLPEERFVE